MRDKGRIVNSRRTLLGPSPSANPAGYGKGTNIRLDVKGRGACASRPFSSGREVRIYDYGVSIAKDETGATRVNGSSACPWLGLAERRCSLRPVFWDRLANSGIDSNGNHMVYRSALAWTLDSALRHCAAVSNNSLSRFRRPLSRFDG
jgi:hypothetical protein